MRDKALEAHFTGLYVAQQSKRERFAPGVVTFTQTDPIAAFCARAGYPLPEMEFKFHATRRWRFDYAWPTHMLALEVEGGVWRKGGGAHSHPLNIERDHEKYSEAAILGWRILHVQPADLSTVGYGYLARVFGEPLSAA